MQVYSHLAAGRHTAVGHYMGHVAALDHSLVTEFQTHKLINLQGLNIDNVINKMLSRS